MLKAYIKRIVLLTFTIFILTGFTSCSVEKKPESHENNFDVQIGTNIVENYMKFLLKNDTVNAKKLYSSKLKKDKQPINSSIPIKGYIIDEVNEIGKSGVYRVQVLNIGGKKVCSSIDEYKIKVIKENNEYKIDEIAISTIKESFKQDFKHEQQVRYRDKNNVKTELVVSNKDLPDYTYSKDDKASLHKINIPRKISTMTLAYYESFLALATQGKDSYISIINMDESKAVQGSDSSQDEDSEQGQSSQENEAPTNIKESPIGKEINSVDILKNSKVEFMVFSNDEKYLLVQYMNSYSNKNIRVYESETGNLIPIRLEDKFPIDKLSLELLSFNKYNMNFNVTSKKNSIDTNKYLGKWQLNLKEMKIYKL